MKNFLKVSILFFSCFVFAQKTQNIRGTVVDKNSGMPLPFVNVVVTTQNTKGTATDMDGNFLISEVVVGRVNLLFSMQGMQPVVLRNIELIGSKELVLNIQMEDDLNTLQEVKIETKNTTRNRLAINKAALVSAKQVSIEEVNKYAGTLNDPARMAMNFAGVQQANDSQNDIVVRGNSSNGVLWRLNDVDIPNPNHFGSGGATGGPVNMINTNLLSNSDFFMSAFVPEYGNATSGVFDLKLRKGNLYQREFIGQVAFNGFELLAEGPIKKEKSSYTLSYRYSVLEFMNKIGITFGTGTAIPKYQDVNFNIYTKVGKKGQLSLFGIGGFSNISFEKPEKKDKNVFTDRETTSDAKMGIVGLQYRHQFNDKAFSLSTLAFSGSGSADNVNEYSKKFLKNNDGNKDYYKSDYNLENIEFINTLQIKLSKKNTLKTGFRIKKQSLKYLEYVSLIMQNEKKEYIKKYTKVSDMKRDFGRAMGFISFNRRFNNTLSTTLGITTQYFTGNKKITLEPRFSIAYNVNNKNTLSFGYGFHTLQPDLMSYSYKKQDGTFYNTKLDYTQAHHLVLTHNLRFLEKWNFKTEAYFQYISNAAMAKIDNEKPYTKVYSSINQDSFSNRRPGLRTPFNLIDGAMGRTYGLEFTLERPLDKGLYFLSTLSLFDSKYKTHSDKWYNTAFNGNFVYNVLFGKEIVMPAGRLSVDIRMTYAGGMRNIPLNLKESQAKNTPIYDFEKPYENQNVSYFRPDFRIGYKLDLKKISQEWAVDIQNVINKKDNIFSQAYDEDAKKIINKYQRGIFPVMLYRIYF